MSWKGFKKGMNRLPHNIRAKTAGSSSSYMTPGNEDDYKSMERQFQYMLKTFEYLQNRSKKVKDTLNIMTMKQIELFNYFRDALAVNEGIVGYCSNNEISLSDLETRKLCKKIETIKTSREQIVKILTALDKTVIIPLTKLIDLLKRVDKLITKRKHKKVDLDRFNEAHRKSKETNPEKVNKIEIQVETAKADFDKVNDLLFEELPILLDSKDVILGPIFSILTSLTLSIFVFTSDSLGDSLNSNAGYGDQWKIILERYKSSKYQYESDLFKTRGRPKVNPFVKLAKNSPFENNPKLPPMPLSSTVSGSRSSRNSKSDSPYLNKSPISSSNKIIKDSPSFEVPVPPYSFSTNPNSRNVPRSAKALYYFQPIAHQDIDFSVNDTLQLIDTSNDDWWIGKNTNGKVGTFPASYVKRL